MNEEHGKYRRWKIFAVFAIIAMIVYGSCGYSYHGTAAETVLWATAFFFIYLAARVADYTITEWQHSTGWIQTFIVLLVIALAGSCGYLHSTQAQLAQTQTELTQAQKRIKDLQVSLSAREPVPSNLGKPKETSSSESSSPQKSKAVEEDIIANSRTGIFHRSNCQYVPRMSANNMVHYSSRDDAIANGYRPCKKCRP